jgi:hypothetical protein
MGMNGTRQMSMDGLLWTDIDGRKVPDGGWKSTNVEQKDDEHWTKQAWTSNKMNMHVGRRTK